MRDNNQKIKLLTLYEMLKQDSEEEHPLTTNVLCERLIEKGISCDRRTLARDIALLNECGYEVLDRYVSHKKGYYVVDRSFDSVELQILVDAVQAANFITENKTKDLIDRIADLGGQHRARILKRSHIGFNTCKHTNEHILYNVDALSEAIIHRKKASFYYFNLNEKHERVYHHNKKLYVVEPLALMYNEDNYYLLTMNRDPDKDSIVVTYRVDRMESVNCEPENILDDAKELRKDLKRRLPNMIKMYSGHEERVTLQFDDRILSSVYDRFGENVRVRRIDPGHCRVDLDVSVSPTFFGWISQFGDKMRILAPTSVVNEYVEHLQKAMAAYAEPDK